MALSLRRRYCALVGCVALLVNLSNSEDVRKSALGGNATLVEVEIHNESVSLAPTGPPPPPKPPTAKSPAPKPKPPAPKPAVAAKPPPPGGAAKSPTKPPPKMPAKKGAKAKPIAQPAPKKAAPKSVMKLVNTMNCRDAKVAGLVADVTARAAVEAAWVQKKKSKSKKGKGKGKGKNKGSKNKLTPCQKEKVAAASKKEEERVLKKVHGSIRKLMKGRVSGVARRTAMAVLSGKMPVAIPGQTKPKPGLYKELVKSRQMAAAAKSLKMWSAAEKKAKTKSSKKMSKAYGKDALDVGADAAATAAIKATIARLSRGKSRRLTEQAVAKAIAMHLLSKSAADICQTNKGKGCKKGKGKE